MSSAVSAPEASWGVDSSVPRWCLSARETGRATSVAETADGRDGWTTGNVLPLIDGAAYFARLLEALVPLQAGDEVLFAGWRSDDDELLVAGGPTLAEVLCDLTGRGVSVRGLVWRSHSDRLRFNAQANERLARRVNAAGGQVLLDQRTPWFGSHHQKLVVIRHRGAPDRDMAFVGGLDLSHGRRDDPGHRGDPQQEPMDARYAGRAPWHDVLLELSGPIVDEVLHTFVERWNDPSPLDGYTPYRVFRRHRARTPRYTEPIELCPSTGAVAGAQAVQMLRTYGRRHPAYPFAPDGERSIARAYRKAFARAQSLIYIEDQYLWSREIVADLVAAVVRSPELRVVVVVPRFPDDNRWFKGPPNRIGQIAALRLLRRAAPERVAVYNLENEAGVPIYVHAKVCLVDDVWFACGSGNLNRRSWTTDSELTCAVVDPVRDERVPQDLSRVGDGARVLTRDLRLRLWGEHLGLDPDDPVLLEPASGCALFQHRAEVLDAWHRAGRPGPRPAGRVRRHEPTAVRWSRIWAQPLHRIVFDPDDRPITERRQHVF